ncbi:XrtA system polysaccharide deacetylase [Desulfofustis glycolicus]|uniref:Polysaccharide deacetylase family protein, PEP-CTERM locus subfamily n=1 Tax=Desulfofustis glycolicus DSM 9705 TaxID=1121409 RepID=A0A1M5YLK4_9BACT|nr:XrtA system polysaccharide deacetylase [Desulfofustis glycolicus]SHI12831.1 polysaccharide deacetylase family protein, PEP-CTERM locus subfamily [Desulfofustis glycolicus DSM 9705]
MHTDKTILLTIDVEDWFQVENFKAHISYDSWASRELRVEANTHALLDLFDTVEPNVKATFFVLAWIAQRCPDLIREIDRRGHEVASHGCNHELCYSMSADKLQEDLRRSRKILGELIGKEIWGYRAPSFSVSNETLGMVQAAGYRYDSSYNSYEGHGRYGTLQFPETDNCDRHIYQMAPGFYEIPVSNLTLGKRVVPWGGGGYFRLLPITLFLMGVRHILKSNKCYTFYIHPWEIDDKQPRVNNLKLSFHFRHYINMKSTRHKLHLFINANSQQRFLTCKEIMTDSDSK